MGHNESISFEADRERISEILDDIESKLRALGVSEKACERSRFKI